MGRLIIVHKLDVNSRKLSEFGLVGLMGLMDYQDRDDDRIKIPIIQKIQRIQIQTKGYGDYTGVMGV